MVQDSSKKIAIIIIISALAVLSFFILRSFLLSIISGLILAFIFSPLYERLHKATKIKSRSVTAFLMCAIILLVVVVVLWLATPVLIKESIKLYQLSKQIDFKTPLNKLFPSLLESEQFSKEVADALYSFVLKTTSSISSEFSNIVLNIPQISTNIFIMIFTFFYALKDKDKINQTIKDLFPFPKEIEEKFFNATKTVTFSILFGEFVTGLIQGLVLSVGIFLFNAPNPFLLSVFSILVGVLPILGPALVGIPLAIYFFINQNITSCLGILAFTGLTSIVDNLIRPYLVSKKTALYPPMILFGMLGGYSFLGIFGLIIGPLVLSYLIIILEIYKSRNLS